jgi:hypothetical protein
MTLVEQRAVLPNGGSEGLVLVWLSPAPMNAMTVQRRLAANDLGVKVNFKVNGFRGGI